MYTTEGENAPPADGGQSNRFYRLITGLSLGIILFMIIAGAVVFFIALEGEEPTLVPDTVGLTIENALIELQEKGLYPYIQLRYSSNPADKSTVLGQDPNPGTVVRAGRQVTLRVSKGAIIDKIENYIGWDIADLEVHLQSLFSTYGPLLRIKTPIVRKYDESPPGTILEQKPIPGTQITSLTDIELIVSLGPQGRLVKVPDFIDTPFKNAMAVAASRNTPFVFTAREAEGDETPGTVVSQSPEPDTDVPEGTLLQFTMAQPEEIDEGFVFGILQRTLPDYPVPVDLSLTAISADGVERNIVSLKHPGGLVSFPYMEPDNTMLIISIADRELIRYQIRQSTEE